MKFLQIHDIPRLAGQGGDSLAEILAIVSCAVVAGLIFWIMRLDKQKEKMAEYQQENDKATLTALNAVTTMLDAVKAYLPEMKGDIKEEINSKGDILKLHLDQVAKQVEEAKSEIRQHLTKRNGN